MPSFRHIRIENIMRIVRADVKFVANYNFISAPYVSHIIIKCLTRTLVKNRIKENIENSVHLEKLYRDDKKGFEEAFFEIYPEIEGNKMSAFWKARLEYERTGDARVKVTLPGVLLLVIACLTASFLIKLPHLFGLEAGEFIFYEKNAGLIVLLGLSLYSFLVKTGLDLRHLFITVLVFLVSAVYINILPHGIESHSINLAYIHLPLLLWCVYGLVFIDFNTADMAKRIDYIRYNGDLAVLSAIILIAGGILAAVTVGLFSAIGMKIEDFYAGYIVIPGLVSVPLVSTFIVRSFPDITSRIAPVVAGIFSPLVLITLFIYLVSILFTGKDPYNDRDFLIVFNLMLLGVMAIIVFSVSEIKEGKKQRFTGISLLLLSILALLVDLIALSAILYRLGEFGFTPNRTAVLGSNLLVFGNLLWILTDLYKVNFRGSGIKTVEHNIARYLPVYLAWTVFVVFVLPVIFGFQ